jgi:arylsulfatase A-like enzyme
MEDAVEEQRVAARPGECSPGRAASATKGTAMPANPPEDRESRDAGLSRRQFLGGAAALAAGLALPALPGMADDAGAAAAEAAGGVPRRPNLIILTTDQERYPRHWPAGWAREHLPNRQRLARHGLTFRRAFCPASMCSPSRASIFTGVYPAEHGVTEVLQYGTDPSETGQGTLQPGRRNMARLLASAGYDVQYRGKWHISKDPSGTLAVQSRRDLEHYGFRGWLTPDAGGDESSSMFGGGDADYDALTARQAAAFLKQADPHAASPFALIVSLVNPHDVMGYPKTWDDPSYSDIPPYEGSHNYGDKQRWCFDQGISLPSTWHEILRENFKPHAQWESTEMWSLGLDPIRSPEKMLDYVNFYAYLHKRSDRDMGVVLDALEANRGLRDRTIVIRLSDHGEMGLAHGGMREKGFNAYEETMHVPLVISNPVLFPKAVRTDALASLVDLMPTLATLANVPDRGKWTFRGRDLTPVIRDAIAHPDRPTKTVQESVLFTTDETIGTRPTRFLREPVIKQPAHIRCIREQDWKFAMYFDPDDPATRQYELYDLANDPHELRNMGAADGPYFDGAKFAEMQEKLNARMAATHTTPGA